MKVKLKNAAKELNKILNKALNEIQSESFIGELADESEELVRKRTRLGFGVDTPGGKKKKLEPLKDSYVQQRRNKVAFYKDSQKITHPITKVTRKMTLGKGTRPKKSNLTRTGQMLEELTSKIKRTAGRILITLTFKSSESRQKAEYAHKGSENRKKRIFMNLSKAEGNQIIKRVRAKVTEIIRKLK